MSTVKEQKKKKTISPGETRMIPLENILVSASRREIEPAKVHELAESIREIGLLNPVTITRECQLVAGAHRLEACRQIGWEEIACTFLEGDSLHLELAEIDENLIRNDLDAISIGELAIRRDEILGTLGLRAKPHGDGSNQYKSKGAKGAPLLKTTQDIANEIGISKRSLKENKQLAKNLVPEAKEVVRKEDIPKKDALKLARMEPERQKVVANRIQSGEAKSVKEAELLDAKKKITAQTAQSVKENKPTIFVGNGISWIKRQPPCDLLISDPPFSTDVEDIEAFASEWLPTALSRVKATGMAYIFVGAYPKELRAYLNMEPPNGMTLEQVLVWTYKNTLGNNPKDRYKLNWQAILFYRGREAPVLDCPLTAEQWAVMEMNAPDGRLGNRYHAWQKPMELAERLIRHSTKPGDVVYDPFACTGTFLLAAAKLGRVAHGVELKPEHAIIAVERGCTYAV
ncbi:MAG: ParB N-terminal domain-containing protein [Planctomycetaceae bacterium]|nr:ParB N-terminal domain-containing protein [Planctomycetaceae bacterium]